MGCVFSSEEPSVRVQSCAVSVPEPIAFYPLNSEYETREIKDRQPKGTPVGVNLAAGRKGRPYGSYRFADQADSYIEFPNNGRLDAKNSITILCRMYPQNTDGPIFSYKTSNPWGIHMRMVSGKLLAHFTHGNCQRTPQLITDQPLQLNQWHHVGSSYDHKTGMASLWLNGQQVQENIGDGMRLATQDNVILGATDGGGRYFQGRVTAMEIYNVALTEKQINAIEGRRKEKELMDTIEEGNFENIEKEVTPRAFQNCESSSLRMGMKVNFELRRLAETKSADTERFKQLANSVEEFTTSFLDPMRSNEGLREQFGDFLLDEILDDATEFEQKKFFTHPVTHEEVHRKWHGRKFEKKWECWKPLLTICCLFDLAFSLILFAVFSLLKTLTKQVSVPEPIAFYPLDSKYETREIKSRLPEGTRKGVNLADGRKGRAGGSYQFAGQADSYIEFPNNGGLDCGKRSITILCWMYPQNTDGPIFNYKTSNSWSIHMRMVSGKLLAHFTDRNYQRTPQLITDQLLPLNQWHHVGSSYDHKTGMASVWLNGQQVVQQNIGVGMSLATQDNVRLGATGGEGPYFQGRITAMEIYDAALTKEQIKAIERRRKMKELMDTINDVADAYLMYLEIPYLKFVRDTWSYIVLVVLHYALCLAPSTISFSGLEWAIFIFFLGRFLVEWKQICDIVKRLKHQREKENDRDQSNYIALESLCLYLGDCWNKLDFASLLVYLVIFILRIYVATWSARVVDDRALFVASFLYGFNTLCLTFRAFGHVMEQSKHVGTIQIALFDILSDIRIVLGQFVVATLAFSFALAKVYMAEKTLIGESGHAYDIACYKTGISCWWTMFRHLGFSLVGLSEFHPMTSVDLPSETLAQILYAAFLIWGVILLINMLIALLSHTYEQTEEKSLEKWSFKRAVTIKAYADYDPIPVPLNIIYKCGQLLFRVARRTKEKDNGINLEFTKSEIFDDLEKEYFAKHTNLLPVTDETKLDHVLQETERNRQMASQILTTTFHSQTSGQGILPRGPEAWKIHEGIRIEGLLLTCEGTKSCRPRKHFHGAQYLQPFSPDFPHFEVTILETGPRVSSGVGVVKGDYDTTQMPGWREESLGYHTDDGKIFYNDTSGRETKGHSMARRGDLIRCTVMFEQKFNQSGQEKVPVCFTLNGGKIIILEGEEDQSIVNATSSLFPYIGLTDGCSVLAKMCPRENKEYEVSKIAKIEKQLEDNNKRLEDTNRKLDILLARESSKVKTWL